MPNKFKIIMTAAHGGFNSEKTPLGGGAAICEYLIDTWKDNDSLELIVAGPGPNKANIPNYRQIKILDVPPSSLSELKYAKFSRAFEQAQNELIIKERPDAVLTHDIAEAPGFAELARFGIPCVPIFHVDVADFFCRMYLKEMVSPALAEHFMKKFRSCPFIPDVLRLVFDKQAESASYCPRLIVPSHGMADVLAKTYPSLDKDRIAVIPWGAPEQTCSEEEIEQAQKELEQKYHIGNSPVIATLSRISPEKGQEVLLDAISLCEKKNYLNPAVFICGEAAFMQGRKFMERLRKKAAKLQTRVFFPGHLGGAYKAAMLRRADIFISASHHESYGLTTMEAMKHATAVIACDTYGARETVDSSCGIIIANGSKASTELAHAINMLLNNKPLLDQLKKGAKNKAAAHPFRKAAAHVLETLRQAAEQSS
ncbi:MAG: glycosyltransferase family 4 protein [bacterium]|nr:glycosyltransferase family 4 protein [bacterium]